MSLFDELRNDARGIAILDEWLGSGGQPVAHDLAEMRGKICLSCREHRPVKWWETAKDAIAETIKHHLEVKRKVDLKVSMEDNLGMCHRCGCCVRLKIHAPIEVIKKQLSVEELYTYPSICWMRKEGT